jgi:flagellar basal-body rod modification protein FlgD
MATVDAIGARVGTPQGSSNASGATQATDAFGLSFENLLKIVLTQLTYQDPLKPMDNFQFVSQLAQFSQIQQSQSMVDSLEALVTAQTTGQAANLLGKVVDVESPQGNTTGTVKAVSFSAGAPTITVETEQGATISSLPLGTISQIREAN